MNKLSILEWNEQSDKNFPAQGSTTIYIFCCKNFFILAYLHIMILLCAIFHS